VKYEVHGTPLGVVFEEDDMFRYLCEECCTSFSGTNEYCLELKADQHEEWHRKQVDR
jgi:hypothetical protein